MTEKALTQRGKYRITFDLSPKAWARLARVEQLVGAETKLEVFRDALQLYEFIAKRHVEGDRFFVKDQAGREESILLLGPELEN